MRSQLRRATQTMSLPFGFTVTVSASVVSLVWRWPNPGIWEMWLFCGGAVLGHALLFLFSQNASQARESRVPVVNIAPLIVAPVVGLAASAIEERSVAYSTVGLMVTSLYVLATATIESSADLVRRICTDGEE